jgi:hypothetical protein
MDYAHDIRLYCDPNDIIVTSRSFSSKLILILQNKKPLLYMFTARVNTSFFPYTTEKKGNCRQWHSPLQALEWHGAKKTPKIIHLLQNPDYTLIVYCKRTILYISFTLPPLTSPPWHVCFLSLQCRIPHSNS